MRKEKVGDIVEYLSVAEYAELRGCTERHVQKMISTGKLKAQEITGHVGRDGKNYRIPIAVLDSKEIHRWKQRQRKNTSPAHEEETLPYSDRPRKRITAEERQEIAT